ncbi:MAG: bifunctional metallophosphatase/5'-nucleotidase [Oscillospiraceae bacterium]|nr:bifunctional metallophosphatase/5'-nucleotidase [Oscillospiraceae bacterium]
MKTLKLYFTSDLHGYFFPTDYISQGEKPLGLFRCASQFEKDGNTLIIDGGDILQGSAFGQYAARVTRNFEIFADIMNASGYDFVTLGNHDFNYGQPALRSYLDRLNATCVCENLKNDAGETLFPHAIHTLENGLRVGIVGVVTSFVPLWEKSEHLVGFQFSDPLEAAREALAELKGKVDLTICVYHGGFERDFETGKLLSTSEENIACRICEELDFDILLSGHQHMTVPGRDYAGTYVIQPPENGKGYALLEVEKHEDALVIRSSLGAPSAVDADVQIAPPFLETEQRVQAWLDEPVGTLPAALPVDARIEMALHGSPLAAFLNQVQLKYSGAELSAVSLANDVRGLPQNVRRRDLFAAYPYANTFLVLEITGQQLKAAVERSAEYLEYDAEGQLAISERFLRPKVEHYNYDFFTGITFDRDFHRPIGNRVFNLRYGDQNVADDDRFTMCINNYRASGAGGYPMYPACPVVREMLTDMTEMLLDYFDTL